MSRKNLIYFDYSAVFERIRSGADIANTVQLAEVIGVSQSAVSQNKIKNTFPLDWAYLISEKYNFNLDWVTRGIPPIKKGETSSKKFKSDVLEEIEEWIEEEKKREPDIEAWFRVEFKEKFPKFAEWKRKTDKDRENNISQQANVA